jgi:hypothetical protein
MLREPGSEDQSFLGRSRDLSHQFIDLPLPRDDVVESLGNHEICGDALVGLAEERYTRLYGANVRGSGR